MFYERKRLEIFSSPGDISNRLDGDRHSRREALTPIFIMRYTYTSGVLNVPLVIT